jgi:hypothetical protein
MEDLIKQRNRKRLKCYLIAPNEDPATVLIATDDSGTPRQANEFMGMMVASTI